MKSEIYNIKQTFLIRLSYGEDILSTVEGLMDKESITVGIFSIIGAVNRATFGYYDQQGKDYKKLSRVGEYEIISDFLVLSAYQ